MGMLLRWLIVVPLALLIAVGAAGFFLMIASVASPPMAQMIFSGLQAFGDFLFDLALSGEDPGPAALAASWQGAKLALSILVAPVVLTALASELFRLPGALAQMALSGLLATALPAAVLGLRRMPTGAETQVLAGLFLTGVVAGAVYWMIAGRAAGRGARAAPTAQASAPPPA